MDHKKDSAVTAPATPAVPTGATGITGTTDTTGTHGAVDAAAWRDLLAEVGADVALPLTQALERVHALTTTGRIDRESLRALREELEAAREASIMAQQLARLASLRLRQSHEQLPLTDLLNNVLAHKLREAQARGIVFKPRLKEAEVVADASLLFSLLNILVDWAVRHARSEVDFQLEVKPWTGRARLECRFAKRPVEPLNDGAPAASSARRDAGPDALGWRLLEQTALAMELVVERKESHAVTLLTIEFPRTVQREPQALSVVDMHQDFATSVNSKPLAGSHVLVVASRREVRTQIRAAIKDMGLVLDMVASVDEAVDFCHEALPHAIVVEGVLRGAKLQRLYRDIASEAPDFAFIEVLEEGDGFQMSGLHGSQVATIGRGAIDSSLPSVLMFELSKGH